FSGIGCKMDVGNKRYIISPLTKFFFYFGKVISFLDAGRSNPYIFAARLHHTDGLFHRADGVHRIYGGHALDAYRIIATHRYMAYGYLAGMPPGIAGQ